MRLFLIALLTSWCVVSTAFAQGTLVLIVDNSSSLDSKEVKLQYDSYATVLMDNPLLHSINVEAIVFADKPIHISSGSANAASAAFERQQIIPAEFRGSTCLNRALQYVLSIYDSLPPPVIIDVSGDGEANCIHRQMLFNTVKQLVSKGAIINTLFIDTYATRPADLPGPREFFVELAEMSGGFSIQTNGWMDFELALYEKLVREVAMLK